MRSGISVFTNALPADTLSVVVADLPVLRQTAIRADGTLASSPRPPGLAFTRPADAFAMPTAKHSVMTGAVEVIALAVWPGDDFVRIRSREAIADATPTDTPSRADQAVVVPRIGLFRPKNGLLSAFGFERHGRLPMTIAFTVDANIWVFALTYTTN